MLLRYENTPLYEFYKSNKRREIKNVKQNYQNVTKMFHAYKEENDGRKN